MDTMGKIWFIGQDEGSWEQAWVNMNSFFYEAIHNYNFSGETFLFYMSMFGLDRAWSRWRLRAGRLSLDDSNSRCHGFSKSGYSLRC